MIRLPVCRGLIGICRLALPVVGRWRMRKPPCVSTRNPLRRRSSSRKPQIKPAAVGPRRAREARGGRVQAGSFSPSAGCCLPTRCQLSKNPRFLCSSRAAARSCARRSNTGSRCATRKPPWPSIPVARCSGAVFDLVSLGRVDEAAAELRDLQAAKAPPEVLGRALNELAEGNRARFAV